MPHIPQILTQANILIKAQLSIKKGVACTLWMPFTLSWKKLEEVNWLRPYEVFVLSFLATSERKKKEIAISFFFVDSRWQLTLPIDTLINNSLSRPLNPNILASSLSLTNLGTPDQKLFWIFTKQNDIDIQRLIVARMISNKSFYLPYSDLVLTPLGITPPLSNYSSKYFNIDPTSEVNFKSGHSLT